MFSSDKNIEKIGRLIESFLRYIKLQNEYQRLGAVEKTVRLVATLVMFGIILLFTLIICIYLSFAAAYAMAPSIGYPWAFCIVAAFYLIVFIIICIFRKHLIERPLVKILASILIDK